MLRFVLYAVPLLLLLLAMFGFAVEVLDVEPRKGAVIRLALFEQPRVPGHLILGTWLVEASGLIAVFLMAQGRFGAWWLDGLAAGWAAWVFRGPLLVVTIVFAARQPQDPWWTLAFGWWVLYSVCGLSLAILARRSGLEGWTRAEPAAAGFTAAAEPAPIEDEEITVELPDPDGRGEEDAAEAGDPAAEAAEPADAAERALEDLREEAEAEERTAEVEQAATSREP